MDKYNPMTKMILFSIIVILIILFVKSVIFSPKEENQTPYVTEKETIANSSEPKESETLEDEESSSSTYSEFEQFDDFKDLENNSSFMEQLDGLLSLPDEKE